MASLSLVELGLSGFRNETFSPKFSTMNAGPLPAAYVDGSCKDQRWVDPIRSEVEPSLEEPLLGYVCWRLFVPTVLVGTQAVVITT